MGTQVEQSGKAPPSDEPGQPWVCKRRALWELSPRRARSAMMNASEAYCSETGACLSDTAASSASIAGFCS